MKHYDADSYNVHGSVGYLLRRSASLMREQLEVAFAGEGLTFVQWVTLILVRDNPRLTPGDVCRDLRHDSGAFTRILDHLEGRGLIVRERSETDRRAIELRVTAAGRHAVDALLPLVVDRLNEALSDFSSTEVATLVRLLGRLILNLDRPARAHAVRESAP